MPSPLFGPPRPIFTSALWTFLTEPLLGKEVLAFQYFTDTFGGILGPYWLILCLGLHQLPQSWGCVAVLNGSEVQVDGSFCYYSSPVVSSEAETLASCPEYLP